MVHSLLSLGMDERGGTTSWGTSGQPSPSYDSSRVSFNFLFFLNFLVGLGFELKASDFTKL
jgi:hypothetical protein